MIGWNDFLSLLGFPLRLSVRAFGLSVFLSILLCWGFVGFSSGQDSSGAAERKIVRRIEPRYPELARKMNISGTVKVFAVVTPDGSVKTVESVGGNPLLLQASQEAVKQWKFVPGNAESRVLIEFRFR